MEPEGGPPGPPRQLQGPGTVFRNPIRESQLQRALTVSSLVTASNRLDVEEVEGQLLFREDLTEKRKK